MSGFREQHEPTFKTMYRTVECPYCLTGYTFKDEAKLKAYRQTDKTEPLHASCIKAAKRIETLILSGMTREQAITEVNKGA